MLRFLLKISGVFASRQKKSTNTEVGLRIGIHLLSRDCPFTDGLHIAYLAIFLQGSLRQIVPGFFDGRSKLCL